MTQASLTLSVLVCMSKNMIRSQLDNKGQQSAVFYLGPDRHPVFSAAQFSHSRLLAWVVWEHGLSHCTEQAGH